ncbi:MAG: MobA/MobL family protein [Pseudomonas sp.]
MAIYHASVKSFSRGRQHSGTAAAAYRAGIVITDKFTGTRHDYTRRRGVLSVDMLAPEDAPTWARDPAACFNASEMAETRKNARVARELEVSLPAELTEEQRHKLAKDLGQMLVDRYSVGVLVAVHSPDKQGDARNYHCHLLMTPRQIGNNGLGARACAEFDARGGAGPQAIRDLREAVAERINCHLEQAQQPARVDHRSLADQSTAMAAQGRMGLAAALAREPTQHEGKTATAMRRRGQVSERGSINEDIRITNRIDQEAFLSRLEKEGRLFPTPIRHTQTAATAERSAKNPPGAAYSKISTGDHISPTLPARRPRAGAAKVQGLTGKGRDAAYYNQRAAEAEERLREAQQAAEDWLNAIEKAGRASAHWVKWIITICNPARARAHSGTPGFRRIAADLSQQVREAARDDTRWDRRLESERLSQWALEEAKQENTILQDGDPQPSIWSGQTSRREWAERRRKRAKSIDSIQNNRNRARAATNPEAQKKYTIHADESLARLECTIANLMALYPIETDLPHALIDTAPQDHALSHGSTPPEYNNNKLNPEHARAALKARLPQAPKPPAF